MKFDFVRWDVVFSEIDKILCGEVGYLGIGECVIKLCVYIGDGGLMKLICKLFENDLCKIKLEGNFGVNLECMFSLCDDDFVFVDLNLFIIEEKDNDIDVMIKYF